MFATTDPTPCAPSSWTRSEITVHNVRLSYIERVVVAPSTERVVVAPFTERQTLAPSSAAPSAVSLSNAAPILLLHGLVAGGECFRPLADHLPADRRLIALDLPGGGYSDRPANADTSFRAIAQLIAAAIPALGLTRPILIGHSYGGAITLELAARHPDLLHSMVLIAPAHPFSGREEPLIRFYLTWPGRWLAHLIPRLPSRLMLEAFRRMPGDHTSLCYEQLETYLQTLRHPRAVPYLLGLLSSWRRDMRSLAKALKRRRTPVPALLIWGDRDTVVPAYTAKALRRRLGPTEEAILPGVGHLPNLERPEQCATLINSWLTSRTLQTPPPPPARTSRHAILSHRRKRYTTSS